MTHAPTRHPPRRHPPSKNQAVRLSEQANAAAHRLRRMTAPLRVRLVEPGQRRATSRRLSAGALAVSAAGLLLLTRVALRPTPGRLDIAATRLLQRRQPDVVTRGMLLLSAPGFAPLQHVLTVGTALDLWAFGYRREALFTIFTMGAGATTGVLKILVGRPRPDPTYMRALFQFRDNSFPSGHCTHYAAFYGYLFYLTLHGMRPSPLRTAILATCATLIAAVAPSRVYLGHHWSSDVLAGDLVGLTYLFVMLKVYENVWVAGSASGPGTGTEGGTGVALDPGRGESSM